jgi:hypothetical protein
MESAKVSARREPRQRRDRRPQVARFDDSFDRVAED